MNKQILILALSAFFVQQVSSQQTSGHEKGDRVIVKKRIIETVNGKETVTETQDTLDLAEFKEMHLHGRDLLKNENEKSFALQRVVHGSFFCCEYFYCVKTTRQGRCWTF